jgi:hypothetical protein
MLPTSVAKSANPAAPPHAKLMDERLPEIKTLDLSAKTFNEFVEYFFNRKLVPDDQQYKYLFTDLNGDQFDEAVPSSPAVVVEYLTRLFTEFASIVPAYSLGQIDQAIWSILGPYFNLTEYVLNRSVAEEKCAECIRSMHSVYAEFFSRLEPKPDDTITSFFMWWDLISHDFWWDTNLNHPGTYKGDPSKLDDVSRRMLDVVFETLQRILNIQDTETQRCALHGLGHLYHPGVPDLVQRYIESGKSELPLAWVEQCRDGKVL